MADTDSGNAAPASRIVSAEREIAAPAARIFELIADPAQQPRWDGNDNLSEAAAGQRVTGVGDVFIMTITKGSLRENRVVEFTEGRLIAWQPSEPGKPPPGHLWRWELEPVDENHTLVRHTYDWTRLTDDKRLVRARTTTSESLLASLDRLAALAAGHTGG
ncbi:MAG: SRPBCC family protein [Nocardia sp.]|nr:SRPBCC family protein [Nocardia sp.]